jgi:hypothetical protein
MTNIRPGIRELNLEPGDFERFYAWVQVRISGTRGDLRYTTEVKELVASKQWVPLHDLYKRQKSLKTKPRSTKTKTAEQLEGITTHTPKLPPGIYPEDWTIYNKQQFRIWRKSVPQMPISAGISEYNKIIAKVVQRPRSTNKTARPYYVDNSRLLAALRQSVEKYWYNPQQIDLWSLPLSPAPTTGLTRVTTSILLKEFKDAPVGTSKNYKSDAYERGLPFKPQVIFWNETPIAASFVFRLEPQELNFELKEMHPYVWEAIQKMSQNILRRPNWSQYTWKKDWENNLICDTASVVLRFDPHKTNPFGYITTIMTNCLLQYLQNETKHGIIKESLMIESGQYKEYGSLLEDDND